MKAYIAALHDAIRRIHGCGSIHVESVAVKETFKGQTVWDGTVEVFELVDHPKATRCHAWRHDDGKGGERFVTVLELPPVDSPRSAVRAAIVAESKAGG